MIAQRVDASLLYADNRLIRDLIDGTGRVRDLVGWKARTPARVAAARQAVPLPRGSICDILRDYNERLGAAPATLAHIDALRNERTLCIITGQQAGFLGGPAYTLYKIVSTVRAAADAARRLDVPVVPMFWLASEDHDFTEINRARLLDDSGRIETLRFDWDGQGRAIENLPVTPEIRTAAAAASQRLAPALRTVFAPGQQEDYARWHARIWSRLFERSGLVLVEPRVLRPLAGEAMSAAMRLHPRLSSDLCERAQRFREAGYEPVLDPARAARPFRLTPDGVRIRVEAPAAHADEAWQAPESFSPDAALRPVLCDALLPTLAHVLGPGEFAYHALLAPLYDTLDIPQPLHVPRHGYTVLSNDEAGVLDRLGISAEAAAEGRFDPAEALSQCVDPALQEAFRTTREDVGRAIDRLRPAVERLDPGLEARWRQAASRTDHEIARLQDKASRADLARQGLSAARVRQIAESVRPGGALQERSLSTIHLIARFGVEWIDQLPWTDSERPFDHYVVTVEGGA